MSEYQYVAFRAVDRPLTEKELAFAETQSSRAEITKWSFENEYHFGDFRGDSNKMLRNGYDVFMYYANFGTRHVAFRLPHGMPFLKKVWSRYVGQEGFSYRKDAKGKGGTLSLSPFHDGDSIDEIWDPAAYMEDLVQLRSCLIQGDLRALYLLWLCTSDDDYANPDSLEPPVPLGLHGLAETCGDVLDFFGLDPLMLAAASEVASETVSVPKPDFNQSVEDWLRRQSEADVRSELLRVLTEDSASVKAEMLSKCRDSAEIAVWPTVKGIRSFEALVERTAQLRNVAIQKQKDAEARKARREAKQAEEKRQHRMKEMLSAPAKWLREAEKLADARGTHNYKAAADVLADLREAVGGDEGEKITRNHAAHLAKKYPTLTRLKSSLRKRGLLD